MKKIMALATGIAAALFNVQAQGDWAGYHRYERADMDTTTIKVVFMGDSVTEAWVEADPEFFRLNRYAGRGISGQTTYQMLARFRSDVVDLRPAAVVILAGTNDIAGNMGEISVNKIACNIMSMCDIAAHNDIIPVICSVLPVYDYPWNPGLEPAGKIIELNSLLRSFARENGYPYVDYHTRMADGRGGLSPEYAADGVHPTREGYRVMRGILAEALVVIVPE